MNADRLIGGADILSDLIDEVREKNFVRVVKFQAVHMDFQRVTHRKVLDEMSREGSPTVHALVLHDSLRALAGKKPVYVAEAMRRVGGDLRSITPNLRTNVGTDFAANVLGSSSQPSQADYIALSNNTITPGATDTSATHPWDVNQSADAAPSGTTGEYTVLGMTRKQATYAHTTSVASYTMSATWTASGAVTSLRLAGLFGGAGKTAQGSGGTNILVLENTFTTTSLASADQLSLTWTVNI